MKTVRIKLYKFNELSNAAKNNAIDQEIRKFNKYFNRYQELPTDEREAIKRLEAYDFDFTKEGNRF